MMTELGCVDAEVVALKIVVRHLIADIARGLGHDEHTYVAGLREAALAEIEAAPMGLDGDGATLNGKPVEVEQIRTMVVVSLGSLLEPEDYRRGATEK